MKQLDWRLPQIESEEFSLEADVLRGDDDDVRWVCAAIREFYGSAA